MKDFTFWSNDEEADEIYAADVIEKLFWMKKIFRESYKGDWSIDYQLLKPVRLISIKDKIDAVLKDAKARNRDVSPGRKLNDKWQIRHYLFATISGCGAETGTGQITGGKDQEVLFDDFMQKDRFNIRILPISANNQFRRKVAFWVPQTEPNMVSCCSYRKNN